MKKPLLKFLGIFNAVTEMKMPWDILWHRRSGPKEYLFIRTITMFLMDRHLEVVAGLPNLQGILHFIYMGHMMVGVPMFIAPIDIALIAG